MKYMCIMWQLVLCFCVASFVQANSVADQQPEEILSELENKNIEQGGSQQNSAASVAQSQPDDQEQSSCTLLLLNVAKKGDPELVRQALRECSGKQADELDRACRLAKAELVRPFMAGNPLPTREHIEELITANDTLVVAAYKAHIPWYYHPVVTHCAAILVTMGLMSLGK